jgi:hypothetical protein
MPIFIERYLLPFLVAVTVLASVTNPMHWDWKLRVGGSVTVICAAFLLSRMLHKHYQGRTTDAVAHSLSESQLVGSAVGSALSISESHLVGSPVAVGSNISQVLNINQSDTAQPVLLRKRKPIGPTPHEVYEAQRKLPPYQQGDAIRHYFNLRVGLPVKFLTIGKHDLGWMAMFAFCLDDETEEHLFSYMSDEDIQRFPRFKTLARGTWMWIEGTIDDKAHAFAVVIERIEFE